MKLFSHNLLAIEIKRTKILMNKPVCLSLSILGISKIGMYEFWYVYMKLKHEQKSKLYIDTNSFIVYIKIVKIYVNIEKFVLTKFDTLNYELERPLTKG